MTYIPNIIDINALAVTVVLDGKPSIIASSNKSHFKKVIAAVEAGDVEAVKGFIDLAEGVKAYLKHGDVRVEKGVVYYKNLPSHTYVSKKVVEFLNEGIDAGIMIRFLDNILKNTSHRSIERGYEFLQHRGMAITYDGYFLAYRGVDSEFWSKTAGDIIPIKGKTKSNGSGQFHIYNAPGELVEVERGQVDDDFKENCSRGVHVGSYGYAKDWAGSSGKVVLVKVHPKDIVTVPEDCNCTKMRVCAYEVLHEIDAVLNKIVVKSKKKSPAKKKVVIKKPAPKAKKTAKKK